MRTYTHANVLVAVLLCLVVFASVVYAQETTPEATIEAAITAPAEVTPEVTVEAAAEVVGGGDATPEPVAGVADAVSAEPNTGMLVLILLVGLGAVGTIGYLTLVRSRSSVKPNESVQ